MGNSKVKPAGWWSRRHETDKAQMAARERYERRFLDRPTQKWDAENRKWVRD